MAVDPVCKMNVEPAKAAAQSTYRGRNLLLLRRRLQTEVRQGAGEVPRERQAEVSAAGGVISAKRWTRLVLDWPAQPDARASGSR